MDMKNVDVINQFIKGLSAKSHTGNLVSTGNKLINYSTVLAQRTSDDFIINDTRYSATTSKIMGQFKAELPSRVLENATFVENVSMGASDLTRYVK